MAPQHPKYTLLRSNIYWLHYKIPAAVYKQVKLSSPLIRLSLNTRDGIKAGSLAQILVLKFIEYCKSVPYDQVTKSSIDELLVNTMINLGDVTRQSIQRPVNKLRVITIREAFTQYRDEMNESGMWRVKTDCDCTAAIDNLIELQGNTSLSMVDSSFCREYKAKLIKYPLHRHKDNKIKNITITSIINSKHNYPKISITTVNNQIRKVSSFFNWLVKQGLITRNPILGMKIKQKSSLKAARSPFYHDDLVSLFSSRIYSHHEFNHDYQFWLPLLALYTGARLEELCQLYINDITLDSPTPFFNIDDSFEGQHLKNNSSRRQIPIHPELIALGFHHFVRSKELQDEDKLFGCLIPQREKLGHRAGQWFSKYKKLQGIYDSKKVFHSFRHTMVDDLKNSRALDYEIKSILGHKNGSITHDIYGDINIPIDSVYSTISKISHERISNKIKAWGTNNGICSSTRHINTKTS